MSYFEKKQLFIYPAILLSLTGTPLVVNAQTTVVDLLPAFQPPLQPPMFPVVQPNKQVLIYGNTPPSKRVDGIEVGTGCYFNYSSTSSEKVQPTDVGAAFKMDGNRIITWNNEYFFCDVSGSQSAPGDNSFVLKSLSDSGRETQIVGLYQDRIRIGLNASEHYAKVFGGTPFYPDGNHAENKPNLFLDMNFGGGNQIKFSDISSLTMTIHSTLKYYLTNTTTIASTPSESAKSLGASTVYNPMKNSFEFRLSIGIHWIDKTKCKFDKQLNKYVAADQNMPYAADWAEYCNTNGNFGNYMFYHVPFMNQKYVYSVNTPYMIDEKTNKSVFADNLNQLMQSTPFYDHQWDNVNPFKIVNQPATVDEANLLQNMKSALLYCSTSPKTSTGRLICAVPPVFKSKDGTFTESSEQYLAHYVINGFNLGFEASTLSNIGFDITKFSLSTTPK